VEYPRASQRSRRDVDPDHVARQALNLGGEEPQPTAEVEHELVAREPRREDPVGDLMSRRSVSLALGLQDALPAPVGRVVVPLGR